MKDSKEKQKDLDAIERNWRRAEQAEAGVAAAERFADELAASPTIFVQDLGKQLRNAISRAMGGDLDGAQDETDELAAKVRELEAERDAAREGHAEAKRWVAQRGTEIDRLTSLVADSNGVKDRLDKADLHVTSLLHRLRAVVVGGAAFVKAWDSERYGKGVSAHDWRCLALALKGAAGNVEAMQALERLLPVPAESQPEERPPDERAGDCPACDGRTVVIGQPWACPACGRRYGADERAGVYRCAYELYNGPCRELCDSSRRCGKHTGIVCCRCGEPAAGACDFEGQFVCGYPLCNGCEHDDGGGGHRAKQTSGAGHQQIEKKD